MEMNSVRQGVQVYSDDGKKIGVVRKFISGAPRTVSEGAIEAEVTPSAQELGEEAGSVDSEMPAMALGGGPSVDAGASSAAGIQSGTVGLDPGVYEGSLDFDSPGGEQAVALGPSDTKYLEVHHGGHLHVGGDSIWVPFSAIKFVESDGTILLRYTASDAGNMFSRRPDPLQ